MNDSPKQKQELVPTGKKTGDQAVVPPSLGESPIDEASARLAAMDEAMDEVIDHLMTEPPPTEIVGGAPAELRPRKQAKQAAEEFVAGFRQTGGQ